MARLQDFQTITPAGSDNLLVVQSQGQGLSTINAVGQKIATETTNSSLNTTSKKLVGAINEINNKLEYKKGDTFNIAGIFSGYLTGSRKEITFSIPLNKPVASDVTSVSFSGGWTIRGISGTYLANNVTLSSLGTVTLFSKSVTGLVVQVIADTAFSETNNTPLAVQARSNVTITLS